MKRLFLLFMLTAFVASCQKEDSPGELNAAKIASMIGDRTRVASIQVVYNGGSSSERGINNGSNIVLNGQFLSFLADTGADVTVDLNHMQSLVLSNQILYVYLY